MSKTTTLTVLSKPQAERVERIKAYHAGCLKAFGDQMGYAFLCGVELSALKAETPHGEFMQLRKNFFPGMPERSAGRYLTFAQALQSKFATVANLKVERLCLTDGELPKKEKEAILEAVHDAADGKTLTEFYRDLGVIRQPKPAKHTPAKELSPDEKLQAELEQSEALVANLTGEIELLLEGEALAKAKPASRRTLLDAAVKLSKKLRSLKSKKAKQ